MKSWLDDLPEHAREMMRNTPPLADEDYWKRIETQFSELNDIVQIRLFETREQAIGEKVKRGNETEWRDTAPEWHDDKLGFEVRAWDIIPYIGGIETDHLFNMSEAARKWAPELTELIERRELSIRFLWLWGAFCQ